MVLGHVEPDLSGKARRVSDVLDHLLDHVLVHLNHMDAIPIHTGEVGFRFREGKKLTPQGRLHQHRAAVDR